jgi:hypothetical protein
MECHLWFQQLRKALREQRVPKRYANRLVDELWFHYLEMKEQDEMNGFSIQDNGGVERLGSPEKLAIQAAQVPLATWSGRHPWLAFIIGAPAITLGLTIVSVLVTAFALIPFAEGKTLATDPWMGPLMFVLGFVQVVVPSIIACFLVCRLVRRSVRSPWWGVVSCGLVAVLCSTMYVHWAPAASIPGTGRMSMGFVFWPISTTWLQATVPLVIGIVFAIKNNSPSKPQAHESSTLTVRAAA